MRTALPGKWSTDLALTALLAALAVGLFVVHPLDELWLTGGVLAEIVFGGVLVAGVWMVWSARARVILLVSAVGIAEAARWSNLLAPAAGLASWAALSTTLAVGLLMVHVLKGVFLPGPITPHRIRGAVAVYLLVGLMWAEAYGFLQFVIPGAFRFPGGVIGARAQSSALLYFSFTTLTTLGYGDVLPTHPVARSLAVVEGLVGQLYPAILIAGLVSLHISSHSARSQR